MKTNALHAVAGGVLRLGRQIGLRVTVRRALYVAVLFLPGTVFILPLLWWLDRRGALARTGQDAVKTAR